MLNLSENMRADLGEAGIGITVLCPGWVKSNIHELGQNRPARFREGSGFRRGRGDAGAARDRRELDGARRRGEMVADAIVANRLYVITHGEFRERAEARHRALMEAVPPSDHQV